jgi:hypothetical protein
MPVQSVIYMKILRYFAASDNGWSYNDLGLQWLLEVLEQHTETKAGRSKHNTRAIISMRGLLHMILNLGF